MTSEEIFRRRTMSEERIYNLIMLAGIAVLLAGVAWQSWLAVAAGALIAGTGGVFGVVTAAGRNNEEKVNRKESDEEKQRDA
jgi:hypothetical protein